jgi:WhiB family transcriptional regulator, redox-sensing transcriptional regulator
MRPWRVETISAIIMLPIGFADQLPSLMTLNFKLEIVRKPKLAESEDWRAKASCRDADPEIFFNVHTINEAKGVCRECPVIAQCLAFAEDTDNNGLLLGAVGVWGGLSETERRDMRKRAARAG